MNGHDDPTPQLEGSQPLHDTGDSRQLSLSDKIILSLLHLATWIAALAGIVAIAASLYSLVVADFLKFATLAPTGILGLAHGVVFRYVRMRLTAELTRA